jgi:hypothetical protein
MIIGRDLPHHFLPPANRSERRSQAKVTHACLLAISLVAFDPLPEYGEPATTTYRHDTLGLNPLEEFDNIMKELDAVIQDDQDRTVRTFLYATYVISNP